VWARSAKCDHIFFTIFTGLAAEFLVDNLHVGHPQVQSDMASRPFPVRARLLLLLSCLWCDLLGVQHWLQRNLFGLERESLNDPSPV
jgi:hypothetical protein